MPVGVVVLGAVSVCCATVGGGVSSVFLPSRPLILSHPEVPTASSAHVASSVRCRIASLHRKEESGAVVAAQERLGAPLGVRHDTYDVAAGVADAGNVVG